MTLDWTELDIRAVGTARILAADVTEKVGNGHPGIPISLAPVVCLLYRKAMKVGPTDDKWLSCDRFVLLIGYASLVQYCQSYSAGTDPGLDDLKLLRTWGSRCAGHLGYGHIQSVECTTGSLGAGISNAVGMAMVAHGERGLPDSDVPEGKSTFDHFVYCLVGDGCLQGGVAAEVSPLVVTQGLGNLIVIYDVNWITVEGDINIAFTEDIPSCYDTPDWHTQEVDWTNNGTGYEEDLDALLSAIRAAKIVRDKLSITKLDTIIGWPLPNKAGHYAVYSAKIGAEEITVPKEKLGSPAEPLAIDEEAVAHARVSVVSWGKADHAEWDEKFKAWKVANPKRTSLLTRVRARKLPADLELPIFEKGKVSTRKASGEVLSALAPQLLELWGGSADLVGPNNTTTKGKPSFLLDVRQAEDWPGDPYGHTIHSGIREHAMGGIINGIVLSGLTRAYGGTFMVSADCMRPAARLAILMNLPSIFMWSHDPIGVGENGPTYQSVEHLALPCAIPNLGVVRPADVNETFVAWGETLCRTDCPAGIILSRQDLRIVTCGDEYSSAEGVIRGNYVLKEAFDKPRLILTASSSEVALALEAAAELKEDNIPTRVVSMPCTEWSDEQDSEYREPVLPKDVKVRVSTEVGIAADWGRYIGNARANISIECFGTLAAGSKCFEEYGFTVDNVIKTVRSVL